MSYDIASRELSRHAGLVADFYSDGFLGSLRPYQGLRESNLHAVMQHLLTAGELLSRSRSIDRTVVEAILTICHLSRILGVDNGSPLVRNQLISDADRARLHRWVEMIEHTMLGLLSSHPPHDCLHRYCEYVADHGWGENYDFFMEWLSLAIESDTMGDRIPGYCAAIVRLGTPARLTYQSLMRARQKSWTWYEPHAACTSEILEHIERALEAIQL